MAQRKTTHHVINRSEQPVYIVPSLDGATDEYIFSDEEAGGLNRQAVIADALSLAGVWRDLDWGEALAELDRIRHQSPPAPPIEEIM